MISSDGARAKPRVLELVRSLEKGGRTVRLLEGVSRLRKLGFDPYVVSFQEPAPWLADRWPQLSDVLSLGVPEGANWRIVSRLYGLIRKRGIDLVHAHSEGAYLYGGIAAWLAKVPIVATWHRSEPASYQPSHKSRLCNRLLTHQVAVSENRRQLLVHSLRAPLERVSVIHGGADLAQFRFAGPGEKQAARHTLGVPSADPVLLGLGHLGLIKGHDVALRAMPAILDAVPSAHLYVAGDGSGEERDRLQRLTTDLGVEDRVTWLGQIHNPEVWLAACDLFVQPPRDEAFGLVFAEAAAVGRPVVATRVGGIPEIVIHGDTGHLVESEDSEALATAVVNLLQDSGLARRMGLCARQRAEEHFSNESMAAAYAALFRRLLAMPAVDDQLAATDLTAAGQ